MAPLIPAAVAAQLAQKGTAALKNDIVTYRTTYVKGKGKKRRTIDREIHVNPVSIGVGLGAVAVAGTAALAIGAIGLYAAGLQAQENIGTSTTYTIKPSGKKWIVYTSRGRPTGVVLSEPPTENNILSSSMVARGYSVDSITVLPSGIFQAKIINNGKKKLGLSSRPHSSGGVAGSLISTATGGLL